MKYEPIYSCGRLIPRCQICGEIMVNAKDSITKKISKYKWKTTCGHAKNLRLNMG